MADYFPPLAYPLQKLPEGKVFPNEPAIRKFRRIQGFINDGRSLEEIANFLGVDIQTLHRWNSHNEIHFEPGHKLKD